MVSFKEDQEVREVDSLEEVHRSQVPLFAGLIQKTQDNKFARKSLPLPFTIAELVKLELRLKRVKKVNQSMDLVED